MSDNTCILCNLTSTREEIVYDGKWLVAVLDINPVNPGHTIIVPKRHIVNFEELNSTEWEEYYGAIVLVTKSLKTLSLKDAYQRLLTKIHSGTAAWYINTALQSPNLTRNPDAFNYGINDGQAAGRTIDHLHWQVIPRFKGDVEDPRGGVRYVIPQMGNYKINR